MRGRRSIVVTRAPQSHVARWVAIPPVRLKLVFGEFAARPVGGYLQMDPSWERRNITSGRVPILGYLFRNRFVSNTNNELLLFITPRIIKS